MYIVITYIYLHRESVKINYETTRFKRDQTRKIAACI